MKGQVGPKALCESATNQLARKLACIRTQYENAKNYCKRLLDKTIDVTMLLSSHFDALHTPFAVFCLGLPPCVTFLSPRAVYFASAHSFVIKKGKFHKSLIAVGKG